MAYSSSLIEMRNSLNRLSTLASISIVMRIPMRYLSRLAKREDFPQGYRMASVSADSMTRNKVIYCMEEIEAYLRTHLDELPTDDEEATERTKEFLYGRDATNQRRGRRAGVR